jgi:dihydrofolate reductase
MNDDQPGTRIKEDELRKSDKVMLSMIVAAAENNAIGKNNDLLWHLPKDLKFFKNTTWGMPVIMGRKTFESFNKPLPGRFNVVITSKKDWNADGVQVVVQDIAAAIEAAKTTNCKEIFIIGGGEIYKQTMPITDRIYITRVHTTLEGDTFFPGIDEAHWKKVSSEDFEADEKHQYNFSFELWERK